MPDAQPTQTISRPIEIVRGYRNISRRMRTSEATVRHWAQQGAPICFDGPVPLTEVAELWGWRRGEGQSCQGG